MFEIHEGQCGLCVHYGETQPEDREQLVQIRTQQHAPEDLIEPCGHPEHVGLHLRLTPISGCDGFVPAPQAAPH